MKLTIIAALASNLLFATSLAGLLVTASPIDPRAALCPSGFKYFQVKSPSGVPHGTCCGANLPGAVWKGDVPACSLSVLFTTPAVSVNGCPQGANLVKKGDLKVCAYSPLKNKRTTHCPYPEYYRTLQVYGVNVGTCCPSNQAVWNVTKPACSISKDFAVPTVPAVSVNTCEDGAEEYDLNGLKICVSLPKTKRSENNRCRDNDKYYVLNTFGLDIGTCCASNLPGAAWNVSTPACTLADNSLTQAHDVITCESDRTFDVSGLKVCLSQPKHVKRDELYCPGGDEWFELENDGETYGFCCGSNSLAATWDEMYGPQCCGDNDEACEGRATSVKGCPSGWDKQLVRGRVTGCKKE